MFKKIKISNISAKGGSASGGQYPIFNIKYLIFLILLFALCSMVFVVPVLAEEESSSTYDINVIEPLTNPLGEQNVPSLLGTTIKAVLSIVGSIALVIFIYGGFQWMTARGNAEQVKSAAQIMLWAALGVFMIFASYLILSFVFKAVK